jgi:hypothetical protein
VTILVVVIGASDLDGVVSLCAVIVVGVVGASAPLSSLGWLASADTGVSVGSAVGRLGGLGRLSRRVGRGAIVAPYL